MILVSTGFSGLGVPFIQAIGLWVLAVASAITVVPALLGGLPPGQPADAVSGRRRLEAT